MSYDAVVFDWDGVFVEVLPDDGDRFHDAVTDAFVACGVPDPAREDVATLTYGVTLDGLRRVAKRHDLDPVTLWEARDHHWFRAQRDTIRTGERDLYDDVVALAGLPEPFGLVSSNSVATVEFSLDHFGLGDRFGPTYPRPPTLDGLHRKKPNPYYVERAVADLGAERALFVGDSPSDVVAARRAGVDSAFVHRPHRADEALAVEPTHELESLADLPDLC
jgi:phosphoglycolate phosphatase